MNLEHIGIAVDTPRGLLVPVVKNAGDLNIPGIAKRVNDLAARTRGNKVNPDELSGSTFTITNTGSGGALIDTPIINQPEAPNCSANFLNLDFSKSPTGKMTTDRKSVV